MIDLQKPFDDLKVLIENTLKDIAQKQKELEGESIHIRELRDRQNNEKKAVEEQKMQLDMEKTFLFQTRNQQKIKSEELQRKEQELADIEVKNRN